MSTAIVSQARAEEADLLRKLAGVRSLLAAYGETPQEVAVSVSQPRPPAANSAAPEATREKVEITSFTEQTRASVVLALQCMAVDTGLKKTRDLVEFIEAMGHTVSGKNPVNALGALLARSADVEGHGKSGWSLVDREKALEIIRKYAPKEKEPTSGDAVGSDADQYPVRTGMVITGSTPSWPRITS